VLVAVSGGLTSTANAVMQLPWTERKQRQFDLLIEVGRTVTPPSVREI
jgi:uncharacterized protein (DUF2236 family)